MIFVSGKKAKSYGIITAAKQVMVSDTLMSPNRSLLGSNVGEKTGKMAEWEIRIALIGSNIGEKISKMAEIGD